MQRTITIIRHAEADKQRDYQPLTKAGKDKTNHFVRVAIECHTLYDLVVTDDAGCATGRHIIEEMSGLVANPTRCVVVSGGRLLILAAMQEYIDTSMTHCLVVIDGIDTAIEIASAFFCEQLAPDDLRRLTSIDTLEHLEGYRFYTDAQGMVRRMQQVRWDTLVELEKLGCHRQG